MGPGRSGVGRGCRVENRNTACMDKSFLLVSASSGRGVGGLTKKRTAVDIGVDNDVAILAGQILGKSCCREGTETEEFQLAGNVV